MIQDAFIGLGGNTGDVARTLQHALELLDSRHDVSVATASGLYSTAPVGPNSGGSYLNAAACLNVTCTGETLLGLLKQVESSLGRQPGDRWTSRRVDLDLLLLGNHVTEDPRLKIPHPHLWYRRFVLDPLAEIAPDVLHPVFAVSIADLREALRERPLGLRVTGGCAEDRLQVGSLLRQRGIDVLPDASPTAGPLQIALPLDHTDAAPRDAGSVLPSVTLSELPGTLLQAAESVVTAVLDEPRRHSRPLRRIP